MLKVDWQDGVSGSYVFPTAAYLDLSVFALGDVSAAFVDDVVLIHPQSAEGQEALKPVLEALNNAKFEGKPERLSTADFTLTIDPAMHESVSLQYFKGAGVLVIGVRRWVARFRGPRF